MPNTTTLKPTRRTRDLPKHTLRRNLLTFPLLQVFSAAPSTHCAPASRPIRGSVLNPIRPRNRQPWVPVTDPAGKVIGERILPGRIRKGSGS